MGLGWVLVFSISISISISILLLSKSNSNKLKPNEFKSEFEFTQALKQNKAMLQHDATTKIKPMINFNYMRIKIRLNESLNTINLRILIKAN